MSRLAAAAGRRQHTAPDTLSEAVADAEAGLRRYAPTLLAGFRAALPAATRTVNRRLLGALVREGLSPAADTGTARRHGFDRVEVDDVPDGDPGELLPAAVPPGPGRALTGELSNAVVNLAIALARAGAAPLRARPDADTAALDVERLAVTGHNLHPCGRTRLGWQVPDVLAHDLEAGQTRIGFVAVRADLHVGDDVLAALGDGYPGVPAAPAGYRLQPVHVWQRDTVRARYGDLIRAGALCLLDGELPAEPTAALRTLLLPPGRDGRRHYLKVSLDIQVTSTRRGISVASTRNGPVISGLLHRLLGDDPAGDTVLLMAETAGAAVPAGAGRDLSAIARAALGDRLTEGERAVPGGALPAVDPGTGRTVVAGLVGAYARSTERRDDADAALAFLARYARLLLPPLLRLTTGCGVALEAHLQNCLPTFVGGVPHRVALRDFAGLRLHRPRLAAAGLSPPLWPGSVVLTDDADVLRAKLGYTALQAHLGELVVCLVASHGLDEAAAWRAVRAVVDDTYEPLRADPRTAAAAAADHRALTAPLAAHKALVRMRLAAPGTGDLYVNVRNPLHAPA